MAIDRRQRNSNGGRGSQPAKGRTVPATDGIIPIKSDLDIILARQRGRELAADMGFSGTDLTLIATAISELARNIVVYAKSGEIVLKPAHYGERKGITVVAHDDGPGIPDTRLALREGYSTSHSLGLGLPGVRRLMDEFEISSEVNRGTTVTVKKWTF